LGALRPAVVDEGAKRALDLQREPDQHAVAPAQRHALLSSPDIGLGGQAQAESADVLGDGKSRQEGRRRLYQRVLARLGVTWGRFASLAMPDEFEPAAVRAVRGAALALVLGRDCADPL